MWEPVLQGGVSTASGEDTRAEEHLHHFVALRCSERQRRWLPVLQERGSRPSRRKCKQVFNKTHRFPICQGGGCMRPACALLSAQGIGCPLSCTLLIKACIQCWRYL